jgi:acetolactate synthase-1/2/3 large subunit
MTITRVSDFIANFFKEKDVDLVFVITGSGSIRLIESFAKSGVRYVCTHHEQAAVMSSLTYMRTTGKPAVVIVTGGPGAINSLTGLADAYLDSLPLFIIAGQENSQFMTEQIKMRSRGVQGLDMINITKTLSKFNHCLLEPKDIRWVLEKAFFEAYADRPGPVWIEVPQNLQWEQVTVEDLLPFKFEPVKNTISNSDITYALELINNSTRPVLLAGNGIKLSGSETKFKLLLQRLGIPVLVSWQAADLVTDDNPLFAGRAGNYGQRFANFTIQNCDLLICLGTRLSLPQRGYSDHSFARFAKKVIVEIDETEINKFKFNTDLQILGNVGEFIDKLYTLTDKSNLNTEKWDSWKRQIVIWKQKYPMTLSTQTRSQGINSYVFIDKLSKYLEHNHIIVTDMGASLTCTHATIKLKNGQKMMTSTGLGEMGFGLPGAIGACLGSNGKPVVLIIGEGSLMFNLQELQTLKNLDLNLKVFLLNNNGYLTIKHTHNSLYKSNGSGATACGNFSDVTFPNFKKVINSFGFKFKSKKSDKNLDKWIQKILAYNTTVFAEVVMPEYQELIPKMNFRINDSGVIVSPPLEDMYPFLEKNELKQQMIIPLIDE